MWYGFLKRTLSLTVVLPSRCSLKKREQQCEQVAKEQGYIASDWLTRQVKMYAFVLKQGKKSCLIILSWSGKLLQYYRQKAEAVYWLTLRCFQKLQEFGRLCSVAQTSKSSSCSPLGTKLKSQLPLCDYL